ncbi:putative secreted protein (Por secretion system target) [Salegentibacter mishustinae]|uniref:LamG-like jellyroll fold domain-containing protein n=1 Tax=Salegentibacter mishustinae TaxID=270918 RepID=UPI000CCE2C9C|nr:LamG-like jellyroll fold domain-containing protein [Salegentibacter mishustinae]PNW23510.1 hypothetical protein APB85_01785 [Salegentibacter mishustinae]PZX66586.1 putative secreted protein (Por secretion system target) [Salegentibacter mishustinae]GGW83338.1 hypothetical protein GCM10008086_09460 [Salegentibacter mishustinae]
MGKITSLFFLAVFIFGLYLLSANTVLANINYGPEKPMFGKEIKHESFFVGFLLQEEPTITAPADKSFNTTGGKCHASGVDLGNPTIKDSSNSPDILVNGTTINPTTYEFQVGTTTVTWRITNNDGTDSDTQTVTVTDSEQPVISHNGNKNVNNDVGKCGANVSVSATATDNCNVGNPTATRSDGQNLSAPYPVGVTTISWDVTDENNNEAQTVTQTITVTDNEKPVITHNGDQSVNTDSGQCGATVSVSATATDNCNVPYPTATRSDGQNLSAPYPVGVTTISWDITDENNNEAETLTQTITVTDKEKPVITHNGDKNINNDAGECGANVSVSATATDNCNVGNPTGIRSDGQNLNAIYPVGTTTITWEVTDENENLQTSVQTIIVKDKEAPVVPILEENITWGCEYTVEAPIAQDNCDGEIIGEPNRSTTFTEKGTIIWTFTDNSGNKSTVNQTITIDQIKLEIATENISCNGFATGKAQAIVNGGVGPITYDWGELGNGTTKDGLSPGSYSVTATDVNGCLATREFTISEPESFLEITNINTNRGCFKEDNASVTVEAQGGTGQLTYTWSNGKTGATINNINNSSASNNLILTITDENGCSIDETITVDAPEELIITDVITTEATSFGSATGTATALVKGGTPQYTFKWSDGQTGQTASGLAAGEYSVTVTDSNNCITTYHKVIIIDPISALIVPTSICDRENEELRTSYFRVENNTAIGGYGPYNYEWEFGNPSDIANQPITDGPNLIQVKYKTTGSKTIRLTVTDELGNEFKTEIQQYVGECFEINCGSSDGSFDIDNIYLGDSNGEKITAENCAENVDKFLYFRNLSNRKVYSLYIEYIYTVTNGDTGEIKEERETLCLYEYQEVPDLVKLAQVDWKCGDDIKLENVLLLFSQNKNRACGEGSNPKCYGSNDQGEVIIPLYAKATANELLCNGAKNGKITVKASGGNAPYSYKLVSAEDGSIIRNNQSSETFEELEAGSYKVIISDSSNPRNTFETEVLQINQPSNPLTLTETKRNPLACYSGEDAEVSVSISGGTAPYTIIWSNGQSSTAAESTVSDLPSGNHSVEVIDANGCRDDYQFEIIEPEEVAANAGNDKVLNCGVDQVKLEAIFEGYTNPRTGEEEFGTWRIINGPAGAVISDPTNPESLFTITATGTYTLEWTIPCGSTDRVKIIFSNCSTIDFDGIDDYIDFGDNLNLTTGFTIEAWVKQDQNATTSIKTILSKRDNANLSTGGYDLIIENNTPKFRWNGQTLSSDYQIDSNRWHHIAVIQGGTDEGIYIDGIKASDGAPGVPDNSENRFLIGAIHNEPSEPDPSNFFHGWIEEVRIWNTSLELDQLKFIMNQRIKNNTNVRGEIIPLDVPNNLKWENLKGYYRLITSEATNGITKNKIPNGIDGRLKNIQSTQQNTAPLPYIAVGGDWRTKSSWKQPQVWDTPNSIGVKDEKINWNIVRLDGKTLTNDATTDNSNSITLLGLLDDGGSIKMKGENKSSGSELRITHYLKLDGTIDLKGESQLVQTEGSILVGNGTIEKQQTGTASSYNYNYWSTPVMPNNTTSKFTVAGILEKGLVNGSVKDIQFGNGPFYVEQNGDPNKINISNYWINGFFPNPQNPNEENANQYHSWKQLGSNPSKQDFQLWPGEGFTMKGTTDISVIEAEEKGIYQTYIFNGFPNNGTLPLRKSYPNQNYLVGNPYPSAVDANEFIDHNEPYINGAIYYWHHFAGDSHYLAEYIGGYATYTKALGLPAKSIDSRIDNSDPSKSGGKRPGRFIPVAQGFFVNTSKNSDGPNSNPETGVIEFTNRMRVFAPDTDITGNSDETQFLKPETKTKEQAKYAKDTRYKIRLNFNSPQGYWRQIGVAADGNTTQGIDYGYEALLIDRGPEDMYWMIGEGRFVIQGVPHFNLDQRLPLGITIAEEKEFSIELGELENVPDIIDIYLRDNSDSTYHDLRKEAFKASLPAGEYQDLYEIVFHDVTSTRKDKEPGEGPIDYYYSLDNREFVISNPELHKIEHINIYNIAGQLVDQHFGIPDLKEIHVPQKKSLSSAVYIVKVYTDSGDYAKKVIIRKD